MARRVDPVDLARALIRRPSVTPADAGALDELQAAAAGLGFRCHRLPFAAPGTADVDNLYARAGDRGRVFAFAGHTDVVPVGETRGWTVDPFGAELVDGVLYGRGAADMKGAIAAFLAAADGFLADRGGDFDGSIALVITGDEEGPAVNGTVRMLDWMAAHGERMDACVVGEPTNPRVFGEMMKNGRRGSLNGRLAVLGAQGHVAYPHLADNPVPRLVAALSALLGHRLDDGTDYFQPSNLEVVTIDVGNPATNVIPAQATAGFNIRFNDRHTGAGLSDWLRRTIGAHAGRHTLDIAISGEAFLTAAGPLTDLVGDAVEQVTGRRPELSTSGGTSDARFIRSHCPVVEFGLVGETMHKVDERARVADILALADCYRGMLERFFA